ncbi:MAG TPA: hypothetical protein VGN00_07775 [Puia sp.]
MEERANGIVIRIDVVLNFELEREILGFGEYMQVLAPVSWQQRSDSGSKRPPANMNS